MRPAPKPPMQAVSRVVINEPAAPAAEPAPPPQIAIANAAPQPAAPAPAARSAEEVFADVLKSVVRVNASSWRPGTSLCLNRCRSR